MRNEEIKYAVLSFAEGSPYLNRLRDQHFSGMQTLSVGQRLLFPMVDCAFAFHLIRAYLLAGTELPAEVCWPTVRRAYRCLKFPNETKRTDPACHEALALGHPSKHQEQGVLKGLLCSGLSYQEVALRTGNFSRSCYHLCPFVL